MTKGKVLITGATGDTGRGGMNDNVELLSGKKPTSVGEFARAHADRLNPKQK